MALSFWWNRPKQQTTNMTIEYVKSEPQQVIIGFQVLNLNLKPSPDPPKLLCN